MNTNKEKNKFFVIYQITNLLNGFIYIGAHATYNINDKYFGSSKTLKKDVKLLGKKIFKKEILFVFDNKEDMMKKEAELVTKEFCFRKDTYNKMIGGISKMIWNGMATAKDAEGNFYKVYVDDPRYLSKELVPITTGLVPVKDKNGNILKVSVKDERYLSGELVHCYKGTIHSEEYKLKMSNIKKTFYKTNPGAFKNKKHSEETKEKLRKPKGLGENNSQFGSFWITNGTENKKTKNSEIPEGWYKGRFVIGKRRN